MKIAIIGGGIGGLTTALTLQRTGHKVTLYEQATQLRAIGAGFLLSANAVLLLQRLGLDVPLRLEAARPAAFENRRWHDNRVLSHYTCGEQYEQKFGAPCYTIHRSDLQHMLYQALPAGIVHLGYHCLAAKSHPDGVDLTFADGSTVTTDIVIGADGIRSVVRTALSSDQVRFSGLGAYRGFVPAERLPFLTEELKVLVWLGPEKDFLCYPVSRGQLINFVATVPAGDWRSESWSVPGRVEDLAVAFSGWNEQVTKIIAAADEISRWALYDCDPLECWCYQRITLLGDAAHPMLPSLGQGACQSIEDAWILAGCLQDATNKTVAAALQRYEAIRKPRTSTIQLHNRRYADLLHLPDGEAQRQRDAQLGSGTGASFAWLHGYDAEHALR